MEAEHCMLLALPHGRDSYDIIQQHNSLRNGIINYLVVKQAAGIVNVTAPGTHQVCKFIHCVIWLFSIGKVLLLRKKIVLFQVKIDIYFLTYIGFGKSRVSGSSFIW